MNNDNACSYESFSLVQVLTEEEWAAISPLLARVTVVITPSGAKDILVKTGIDVNTFDDAYVGYQTRGDADLFMDVVRDCEHPFVSYLGKK